ncbi:MAG: DNA translocase FtsK 4TM domain-containing protein, partial [bacterium]
MKTLKRVYYPLGLVFIVILTLSILSFEPSDSSYFTNNPNNIKVNVLGNLGAGLSSYLFLWFGSAFYFIILLAISFYIFTFPKKFRFITKGQVIGEIVLIFAFTVLLSLISDSNDGGIIGGILSGTIEFALGKVGVYIVLFFMILSSLAAIIRFNIFSATTYRILKQQISFLTKKIKSLMNKDKKSDKNHTQENNSNIHNDDLNNKANNQDSSQKNEVSNNNINNKPKSQKSSLFSDFIVSENNNNSILVSTTDNDGNLINEQKLEEEINNSFVLEETSIINNVNSSDSTKNKISFEEENLIKNHQKSYKDFNPYYGISTENIETKTNDESLNKEEKNKIIDFNFIASYLQDNKKEDSTNERDFNFIGEIIKNSRKLETKNELNTDNKPETHSENEKSYFTNEKNNTEKETNENINNDKNNIKSDKEVTPNLDENNNKNNKTNEQFNKNTENVKPDNNQSINEPIKHNETKISEEVEEKESNLIEEKEESKNKADNENRNKNKNQSINNKKDAITDLFFEDAFADDKESYSNHPALKKNFKCLRVSRFDEEDHSDETKILIKKLESTLEEFKIEAKVIGLSRGPVITRFEIQPAPGIKLSKIVGLSDNISLSLGGVKIRIIAPIP